MGLPPFRIILEPASCIPAITEGKKPRMFLPAKCKGVPTSIREPAAVYDLG
jgi:hypothetical protein